MKEASRLSYAMLNLAHEETARQEANDLAIGVIPPSRYGLSDVFFWQTREFLVGNPPFSPEFCMEIVIR